MVPSIAKEITMATDTDRSKALDMALGQIDKQFGKGSVMRMGEKLSLIHISEPTRPY